jgi:large subunit ribosomal protein L25
MDEVTLVAEKGRPAGKSTARRVRRGGKIPAVVYGLGGEAESIAVPERDLIHILHQGVNTLINLEVNGSTQLVLARQVQRHPVRRALLHVDFVRVRRDVAVTAEVPIHLVGEAAGVRDGGILDQAMFTLTVEANPGDIPSSIEADVSGLDLGSHVRVHDLALPRGVVTHVDPEEVVANVLVPRGLGVEEEEAEAAAEEEGAEAAASEGGETAESEE